MLVPYLEHYLTNVRSVLLQGKAPAVGQEALLWYTTNGRALSARRFHQCLCEHTKAAFDCSVNPHLFRDCAATTIALDNPEHVRVAAQVLGHASFATTERHYRMSRSAEATRIYQTVLDELASGTGK